MIKVIAIIITFNPQREKLNALISSLFEQVSEIVIMNNGDKNNVLNTLNNKKITIIDMHGNKGIAKAINQGALYSKSINSDFIVTFDQDSIAAKNHISELIKIWNEETISGVKVGGVGPFFYDNRGNEIFKYPFYKKNKIKIKKVFPSKELNYTDCDILITSGMLIKTETALEYKFLDDLFIDFIDTEWCFRTAAYGYKHFGSFQTGMQHELSDEKPIKIFGFTFLKYSAFRRYYFFRNSIYMLKSNKIPTIYKIKILISSAIRFIVIPFTDDSIIKSIKSSVKGIKDGFILKI